MKEISLLSDGYEICRYFTPSALTASQPAKSKRVRGLGVKMSTPLTYKVLLEHQMREVQLEKGNAQTAANRASVLRIFLRVNHLSIEDVVGDEMRAGHLKALSRYTRFLERSGWSARNISNAVSSLRTWKKRVLEHDTVVAIERGKATPFQIALKSSIGELPVARVAKEAGVPKDMLWGWLKGKVPRASSGKFISRLETYLAIGRNSLLNVSGIQRSGLNHYLGGEPQPISYNEKIGKLTATQFWFRPDRDSSLREQWTEFLRYKTATVPDLKRTLRGRWRFSPCPLRKESDASWWNFLDGKEIASAGICWGNVARYLGWLALPKDQGGKAFRAEALDTLAWLVVPDHVEEHLDWHRTRIGGRNRGATQFVAFVASLVRPVYGYLRQKPDLQKTLPEEYWAESWDSLCDRQFELVQHLAHAYKGETEPSRDSFAPIRHIIHLPQPMDAIADMIQRMRADRPVGNPRLETTWARDLFLVMLLVSNPLRRRMMAHLTWRADNTGLLYQRPDDSWWIRIPRGMFKNTAGAAGDRDYDCQVHPKVWPVLEQYLFDHRPKLMLHPTDLVFLPRPSHGITEHRPWGDLSKRVNILTAKYLPRCAGTGAHAFRHIVATSILKADGGDYKTAALVLNNRPTTVERHYAGLRSNDGAERMAKLLEGPLSRM